MGFKVGDFVKMNSVHYDPVLNGKLQVEWVGPVEGETACLVRPTKQQKSVFLLSETSLSPCQDEPDQTWDPWELVSSTCRDVVAVVSENDRIIIHYNNRPSDVICRSDVSSAIRPSVLPPKPPAGKESVCWKISYDKHKLRLSAEPM